MISGESGYKNERNFRHPQSEMGFKVMHPGKLREQIQDALSNLVLPELLVEIEATAAE